MYCWARSRAAADAAGDWRRQVPPPPLVPPLLVPPLLLAPPLR
jgi:hypothetical protein